MPSWFEIKIVGTGVFMNYYENVSFVYVLNF